MNVAIMTQPLGQNYGGIMQAWALQQVLKRMGHTPVTIDRQPDHPPLAYRAARLAYRIGMKAIGRRQMPIYLERLLPLVQQHTRGFIAQDMTMSAPLYSTEQLSAHFRDARYEAVIVGSDQTWRPQYSPNIGNYFLDFLADQPIKKLAYGASFGVADWEFDARQTAACVPLAQQFDAVSVRELSAVALCAEHLGVNAQAVLDPTLLLEADAYRVLMAEQPAQKAQSGGLYTYVLDKSAEKTAFIQRVSAKLGLMPYSTQAPQSVEHWAGGPIEQYRLKPISQWLAGFQNAQFVATDSFHGMVFAIVFNKPFLVVPNQGRGNARFDSLLNQLGLINRLHTTDTQGDINLDPPCGAETVAKLTALRTRSLKLLEDHL